MIIDDIPSDTVYTVQFGSPTAGTSPSKPRFTIGYWSIRGLGAPIRMMLCAAQITHDVILYDIVEGPDKSWNSEWFQPHVKGKLRDDCNPFINLPFLVDREDQNDHLLMSQTNAILTHLGRACNMLGTTAKETAKCEELLCELMDLRNVMVGYAYGGDSSLAATEAMLKKAAAHLKKLEHGMTSKEDGKGFLVGTSMTSPDFHLFEMLDQFEKCSEHYKLESFFANYPSLKEFKTRFETLSENQFYLKSPFHNELPLNNCMAGFGSQIGPAEYIRGDKESKNAWRNLGQVTLTAPSSSK